MAVSKRLRYEILRRDNHACRYCGGIAPDVILTVDHVVAVALGGSDDPSNLVAACKDCNSGKSATPVGAEMIADVSADAVRWATAMRAAFDKKLGEMEARDAYIEEFKQAWDVWTFSGTDEHIPMPSDWERSIEKWYALGLPMPILRDAIRGAMNKRKLKGYEYPEFRYMAGIIWGTLAEMEQQVAAQLAAPEPSGAPTHQCDDPWCAVHNSGNSVCHECGQPECLWACGYELGRTQGRVEVRQQLEPLTLTQSFLSDVCDGRALAQMGIA